MNPLLAELRKPFVPEAISWRVGSTNAEKTKGLALAYIDARDVQDRLDDVVGPENWRDEYQEVAGFLICKLWLKIGGEWIWKCDGAGKTDVEAEKGMVSDSFKRAAVKWGIGRYLYNLDSPWVAIEARGRSYVIAQGEHAKLRALLGKADVQNRVSPAAPQIESVAAVSEAAAQYTRGTKKEAERLISDALEKGRAATAAVALDPKTEALNRKPQQTSNLPDPEKSSKLLDKMLGQLANIMLKDEREAYDKRAEPVRKHLTVAHQAAENKAYKHMLARLSDIEGKAATANKPAATTRRRAA